MLVIMLPKKDPRHWWKVLLINLTVVVAFGAIALTLPHLTNQNRPVDGVNNDTATLVCRLVTTEHALTDYPYCWQIYTSQNGRVVISWDTIYQESCQNPATLVVSDGLKITAAGLVYTGEAAIKDFIGWARYRGQTVTVRL